MVELIEIKTIAVKDGYRVEILLKTRPILVENMIKSNLKTEISKLANLFVRKRNVRNIQIILTF